MNDTQARMVDVATLRRLLDRASLPWHMSSAEIYDAEGIYLGLILHGCLDADLAVAAVNALPALLGEQA